jgi:hypothetical protein
MALVPCYDPHIHVTARDLRAQGAQLDEDIPDHAFVRRSAVRVLGPLTEWEMLDNGNWRCQMAAEILEGFTWSTDLIN